MECTLASSLVTIQRRITYGRRKHSGSFVRRRCARDLITHICDVWLVASSGPPAGELVGLLPNRTVDSQLRNFRRGARSTPDTNHNSTNLSEPERLHRTETTYHA